jgi:hypothetical protein
VRSLSCAATPRADARDSSRPCCGRGRPWRSLLNGTIVRQTAMNVLTEDFLRKVKSKLLEQMRQYKRDAGASYDEPDVQRCGEILDQLAAALTTASSREEALKCVRTAVLNLNALNSSSGGDLIETDQREMIYEFIIKTCALRGFSDADEDVTLEWREW